MEKEIRLSSNESDGGAASRRQTLYGWAFMLALLPVCMCAFLLLLSRGRVKYYPPILPAPGYSLLLVTQPDALRGALKRVAAEVEFRSCTYELDGWQEERIYYTQSCAFGVTQSWVYHVTQSSLPKQIGNLPQNLYVDSLPVELLREKIRMRDWNDLDSGNLLPHHEKGSRHIAARQDGLVAPDGKTIALVTRHIYGPEDVIILMRIEE